MGQYEIALLLQEAFRELGADRPQHRVRVTRTIVVEGPLNWVVDVTKRAWLPDEGCHQTGPAGAVSSCTDRTLKVLD